MLASLLPQGEELCNVLNTKIRPTIMKPMSGEAFLHRALARRLETDLFLVANLHLQL
jgi:hypothetical protein